MLLLPFFRFALPLPRVPKKGPGISATAAREGEGSALNELLFDESDLHVSLVSSSA